MKKSLLIFLIFNAVISFGQKYEPDWNSLDQRPAPQWFQDVKFGIFIHWGVYSVPGWCTVGNYSEWYLNGLNTNDTARINYHEKRFGNKSYYELADGFQAELYRPEDWASLIEKSGAGYVVLTSKHHDGFALWPSPESSKAWGFPWNSKERGPGRDLLGELFAALRKTDVKPGLYYSLYEWGNPWWQSDKKKYINEYMMPQMKELVNKYEPAVLWTDGEWDLSSREWGSRQFLAWLYNESPVKKEVIVNDRWGNDTRFRHGGVFTPEYQPNLSFDDHYWEESRGIGYSYGYNRGENAWDYASSKSLIISLIDKVSRGGNFLLDIGPDEHGLIPPLMQERLLDIGNWLGINGESIYHTSKWKKSEQWSEGNRNYTPETVAGSWKMPHDYILKMTVDPDPGYAVKELFFTYNPSANNLYVLFARYPDNKKIILKDIVLPRDTRVTFLATGQDLTYKINGGNTEIILGEYNPNKILYPSAFAIKIHNFGRYSPRPRTFTVYDPKTRQPKVHMQSEEGSQIFYTISHASPSGGSTLYVNPFGVAPGAVIRFFSKKDGIEDSPVDSLYVYPLHPKASVSRPASGLSYRCFKVDSLAIPKDIVGLVPVKKGISPAAQIDINEGNVKMAVEFNGYLNTTASDIYTFMTDSPEGCALYVDDELILNNMKPEFKMKGQIALEKGFHKIRILYINVRGKNPGIEYKRQSGSFELLQSRVLFH